MLPCLVTGFAVGLAVAAPVGPMSVLCMRRTLVSGWWAGFRTGLGIAVGDGIYALIAALGLSGVAQFMLAYSRPLHFAAGLFLVYLAVRTLWPSSNGGGEIAERGASTAFRGAVLLTLTNPSTIISFIAVLTVLAPARGFDPAAAFTTVGGVVAGSAVWWLGLTAAIALVREAIGPRVRRAITIVSAAALGIFGFLQIGEAMGPRVSAPSPR